MIRAQLPSRSGLGFIWAKPRVTRTAGIGAMEPFLAVPRQRSAHAPLADLHDTGEHVALLREQRFHPADDRAYAGAAA